MVQFNEEKEEERIDYLHKKEEEESAAALSQKLGLPYLDLTAHGFNIDALRVLKEDEAKAGKMAVFNLTDKDIDVGLLSLEDANTKATIESLKGRGYKPSLYIVSRASLQRVWDRYKDLSYSFETKSGALDISNDEILEVTKKVEKLSDVQKLIQDILGQKKAYRVSKILEIILAGGIAMKASDIHLEPEETSVRLRYRLDGVLTDILHFD